jgi:hypothetical protein
MPTVNTPAKGRWSQNAIGSIVALFICFPMAPVLALLALRDCAQTPGMKGRGLAFAVLLLSLAMLTVFVLSFLLRSSGAPGSDG